MMTLVRSSAPSVLSVIQFRSADARTSPNSGAISLKKPNLVIDREQHHPLIHEAYRNYAPPVNVAKNIQILLTYVPTKFLSGLGEIVLTNVSGLSRERRRKRTAGGSPIPHVRGLYYEHWNGEPARIEILVDRTLEELPRILRRFGFFQNMVFSEVLYHEIGHHIHTLPQYKFKSSEREAFADKCRERLIGRLCLKRYWYLQPIIFPIRAGYRAVRWLMQLAK